MFKFSHAVLIIFSGLLWLGVGVSLLFVGFHLMADGAYDGNAFGLYYYPILDPLASYVGGYYNAMCLLMALGLAVGYLKARFVLSKSVTRVTNRIRSLPNPASIFTIYNAPYCILIGCMILLGMGIKWLGIPGDVRGLIDIAIGSALVNGAMLYFRSARKPATT